MNPEQWSAVDAFICEQLFPPDPVLEAALADMAAAGLPAIQVTPSQGRFLQLLARSMRAEKILEIGTLGAYSTIWLGRALPPGGRLITLELDTRHAEVARGNLARAGLEGMVEVRLGKAIDSLPRLVEEGAGPFDMIFIDADKTSTQAYYEWVLQLARPGSLIVVDNVVRGGQLANPAATDDSVRAMRSFLQNLNGDRRVSATVLQTVGSKGYDGLALFYVIDAG